MFIRSLFFVIWNVFLNILSFDVYMGLIFGQSSKNERDSYLDFSFIRPSANEQREHKKWISVGWGGFETRDICVAFKPYDFFFIFQDANAACLCEGVVKKTWPKHILVNLYANVGFFTSPSPFCSNGNFFCFNREWHWQLFCELTQDSTIDRACYLSRNCERFGEYIFPVLWCDICLR